MHVCMYVCIHIMANILCKYLALMCMHISKSVVTFEVNDVVKIMFPEWSRQGVLVECYNVHRTLWHLLS